MISELVFLADFREGVVLTSVNPLPAIKKVATCFLKQLKFGTDLVKRLLVWNFTDRRGQWIQRIGRLCNAKYGNVNELSTVISLKG